MLSAIVNACKSFYHQIKTAIKQFTKPETAVLVAGAVSDITRSRKDLIAENAILRQQLIVRSFCFSCNTPNSRASSVR